MTNDITAFDTASNLPAYLQGNQNVNEDLTSHASQSFPVLSIKGKVFAVVRGTERAVVPNPKDPEAPATRMPIIIVKANKNNSKTYYAQAFKEGVEDVKPTCFSNDGIRPDPSVEHPQCSTCANCKWNVFGTARGSDGTGKGKACSDCVRVAITPANDPTEAYLLRVPPASIKNLGELGTTLARRKVPYQAVVVELSFDQEQATPRLVFKPTGFVNEATYKHVMEMAETDIVKAITGTVNHAAAEQAAAETKPVSAPKNQVEQEADDLIKTVLEPEAKMPKAKVANADSLESALDSIGFDD